MIEKAFLIENIATVREIIDFFHLEYGSKEKYEEGKNICKGTVNANHGRAYENSLIDMGYLSTIEFLSYRANTGNTTGINNQVIGVTIKLLVDAGIIVPFEFNLASQQRYKWSGRMAHFLYENDLIINVLFGFSFIIDRYKDSVILIEQVNKKGDKERGTGFYCRDFEKIMNQNCVITNKHVVDGAQAITLYDNKDRKINHREIAVSNEKDLAVIYLEQPLEVPPLVLDYQFTTLDEIITIGYPSIPGAKFPYQTFHKGEVNSLIIEEYLNHQELFLFSAKTSSGNSGSPVVNKFGMVIGIVTQDLFEQRELEEKGKLPYYCAIPSKEILEFMCFQTK